MVRIEIISGFLGAGKTTFIKKLIHYHRNIKEKIVLIENEYGEAGIDGILLRKEEVEVRELYAGCICCSLHEDFTQSVKDLIKEYQPDVIIIEPSGVGKLSDILLGCDPVIKKNLAEITNCITIVDVQKVEKYLHNFRTFYHDQLLYSDTIVFSKIDITDQETSKHAINKIKQTYPQKQMVSLITEMIQDDTLEFILRAPLHNTHNTNLSSQEATPSNVIHHHPHGEFSSWSYYPKKVYTNKELSSLLQTLEGGAYGTILRAKGFVKGSDDNYMEFSFVPGQQEIHTCTEAESRLNVIGVGLRHEELERLFADS